MAGLRIVTCHLGAGASLAAVLDGRSVDTHRNDQARGDRDISTPAATLVINAREDLQIAGETRRLLSTP